MNSELDVKAIRERVEKATPGPFTVEWSDATDREEFAKQFLDVINHGGNEFFFVEGEKFETGERKYLAFTGNGPTSEANANFLANAHTDTNALLSALSSSERLVRELATAIKDYTTVGMLMDPTFPTKYERLKEVINTESVRRILEGK